MNMDTFYQVKQILQDNDNIVFFGGAGVSTASGIPDFRSATGLYNRQTGNNYSPEYMLSHTFFMKHPEEFYRYLRNNLYYPDAKPNNAHKALVKLEKMGKLKAIVTQNIDGLHQVAGSGNVIEFHGNSTKFYCMECGKEYPSEYAYETLGVPKCNECGGIVRFDVVLYEEPIDQKVYSRAIEAIGKADVLIVGGTSLVVYPAAGLLQYYKKDKLILINQEATMTDNQGDYILIGDISKILWDLVQELCQGGVG
ncbi:NAD-dependent deacetylase [Mobilisporobacter senegalensis]|uniref:NAD-dependent protein deacetylase n=2 Tax=Mobilisporobacter senegalensis TaxID=1329262 RepID=A0A3N1Y2H0_9FIRM|nr:NAD-dependent protein deacylase [Mobilisporobacter senegalensis]ROR31457.1 NAD-dependent deacetylase [Mobilisporobacter senegalensis]